VTTALWILAIGVAVLIFWDICFRNRKGPL
jgi:hypothetical protein